MSAPNPLSPFPTPTPTLREARSRSVVEALLVLAIVVSLVRLATAPGPPETGPRIESVPVDVARDGPGRLRLLPGFGPTRVAALLADRRARGPVRRVEELARIRGIGSKTLDALREAGAVVRPDGNPVASGPSPPHATAETNEPPDR